MLAVLLLCFVVGIVIGLPILFVIISSTIAPGFINPDFIGNIQYILRSIVGGGDNTSLLACPCFILSGVIMKQGQESPRKYLMSLPIFLEDCPVGCPAASS